MSEKKKNITPKQALQIFGGRTSKMKLKRIEKDLSQSDLEKKSGIKIRSIQMYEQGDRDIANAGLRTICAICEALDCTIGDILDNEELLEKYRKVK